MHNKSAQLATVLCKKNINDLHVELRQPSETITHATANSLNIQVTSTFKWCEDCALGKTNQCAVSKEAIPCSKIFGERLFFDISSPYTPTFGSKQHWLLVIDDSSDFIWSFFLKDKSNLMDIMVGLVTNPKNKYDLQVQHLCCNNAGDNVSFERACRKEGLEVDFEYTASNMPQQNGHVKWKFTTSSTGYMPCSTAASSMLTYKMANGPKQQTLPYFSKTTWLLPLLGREREASCLWCKILVKCVMPPTEITHTRLN